MHEIDLDPGASRLMICALAKLVSGMASSSIH